MSTTKFTATHPTNHTTVTRTSKSKTYAYVVWCQHTAEHYRFNDERSLNSARNEQARYEAVVASGVTDSKYLTVDDYRRFIADLDVRIARLDAALDANEYADDEWGAWSWSSRIDLAEKEVRSATKRCPLSRFLVGEVD
jgi:hypothetical protein